MKRTFKKGEPGGADSCYRYRVAPAATAGLFCGALTSTPALQAALKLGAAMEEIIEVLKLCVVQGVQARNLPVPILAKEIANRSAKNRQQKKRTKP